MYKIVFYQDKNGNSEVVEYIKNLKKMIGKEARQKQHKIDAYFKMLEIYWITITKTLFR